MNKPAFTIITDGTNTGTQILDSKGGPIENVTGFSFSLDVDGRPEFELRLSGGAFQAAVHEGIVIETCLYCGEGTAHICKGVDV